MACVSSMRVLQYNSACVLYRRVFLCSCSSLLPPLLRVCVFEKPPPHATPSSLIRCRPYFRCACRDAQNTAKNAKTPAGSTSLVFGCHIGCHKFVENGYSGLKTYRASHLPQCAAGGVPGDRQVCIHGPGCHPRSTKAPWTTQALEKHLKEGTMAAAVLSGDYGSKKKPGGLAVRVVEPRSWFLHFSSLRVRACVVGAS